MKRLKACKLSVIMFIMIVTVILLMNNSTNVYGDSDSVSDLYTYTITPILEPFNEYFFVRTDNPDPETFRFVDKTSKYSDSSIINIDWDSWNEKIKLYEDIRYEDIKTGRVDGGYIFSSFNTDGGEVELQVKENSNDTWHDTNKKYNLLVLKDDADYLIDKYSVNSNFFNNMDAIQSGFSSICLYSGSSIRGSLYKAGKYWSLSSSPHIDQTFYIQSPYRRKDGKKLFASAVYPYRYDSLGFPGMMGTIAKRLDSSASYEWNGSSHAYINVTYGEETRIYGGCGRGNGQEIGEDMIKQYFEFGSKGTDITLEGIRQLLCDYSEAKMEDDVPKDDALTWKSICDTVGDGAWVRLIELKSVFGGSSTGYAYLNKEGEGKNFSTGSAGSNGSEIYWGGDLGYASDIWIDGRYISSWETFVKGAKFEDYPTSDIMIRNVTVPQIKYRKKYTNGVSGYEYIISEITEKEQDVVFNYSETEDKWIANSDTFDEGCADYSKISEFEKDGLIDNKYSDMITLTQDEVKEMHVDRNKDITPEEYYIYDGSAQPGTYRAESELIPLEKCSISLSRSDYVYDGKLKEPAVVVEYGTTTLIQDKDYTVRYESNKNAGIAKVVLKASENGNCKGEVTKEFIINKAEPTLKLSDRNMKLVVGDSNVKIKATTNSDGRLLYKSSNSGVAVVDANGKITSQKAGNCTITVMTSESKNFISKKVTVRVNVIKLKKQNIKSVSKITKTYGDGKFTLNIKVKGGAKVAYTSNNKNVVTVSKKGIVKIVGPGKAIVYVKVSGTSAYMPARKQIVINVKKHR